MCDQHTRYVDTYTFCILSSHRWGCQGHIPPWFLIQNPKYVSGKAGSRRSVYSRRMNKGKTLVCLYWNWISAFCQCSLLFGWLTAGLLYRHSSPSLGGDLSRPITRLHWEGHLRLSPEEKGKEGEAEEEKKRISSGGSGATRKDGWEGKWRKAEASGQGKENGKWETSRGKKSRKEMRRRVDVEQGRVGIEGGGYEIMIQLIILVNITRVLCGMVAV